MVKLIEGQNKIGGNWKLDLNGEILEKVKIHIVWQQLILFVSLDKTSKTFFEEKLSSFLSLQSD